MWLDHVNVDIFLFLLVVNFLIVFMYITYSLYNKFLLQKSCKLRNIRGIFQGGSDNQKVAETLQVYSSASFDYNYVNTTAIYCISFWEGYITKHTEW